MAVDRSIVAAGSHPNSPQSLDQGTVSAMSRNKTTSRPPPTPRPTQTAQFPTVAQTSTPQTSTTGPSTKAASAKAASTVIPVSKTKKFPITRATQCTHMSMTRMYGDWQICSMCGRAPSLGFVYACDQDLVHLQRDPSITGSSNAASSGQSSSARTRKRLTKSRKRGSTDIESLGFATWILDGVKEGFYTPEQIDKLITQKSHVLAVAAEETANNAIWRKTTATAAKTISKKVDDSPNGSTKTEQRPASPKGTRAGRTSEKSKATTTPAAPKTDRCAFKVCHACRPYCRDRSYNSIEAAVKGEINFPRRWYPSTMPVQSVQLMREIGTGPHYRADSTAGMDMHVHDVDEGPASGDIVLQDPNFSLSPALKERPSSFGFRASLRNSLINMLRELHVSRDPDIVRNNDKHHELDTLDEDISSSVEKAERMCLSDDDADFDLGLWRRLAKDLLDQAAATALPDENDSKERLELIEANAESEAEEEVEAEAGTRTGNVAPGVDDDDAHVDIEEAEEAVEVEVGLKEEAVQAKSSDFITSI